MIRLTLFPIVVLALALSAGGCADDDCAAASEKFAECGSSDEAKRWAEVGDCSDMTACVGACIAEADCAALTATGDIWNTEIRTAMESYLTCLNACYGSSLVTVDHSPAVPDPPDDHIDSESANSPNVVVPQIDLVGVAGQLVRAISGGATDELFNNSNYECGSDTPTRLVVCSADVLPMPAGDIAVLGHMLAAPVPRADPSMSYIHSAVFDSDGDPANDWVFNPPFDFDLFQGTDRWYQLIWDHSAAAWSLTATQVQADMTTAQVPTTARAIIGASEIIWYISASEFMVSSPGYRLTSFGHDGNFSRDARGADVSGADPTGPLLPLN